MKTLYLVRHAKSSWKFEELTDHDRPLNKRGRKAAPQMGKVLHEREVAPDLLVSSPAVRAISTATLIAKELDYDVDNIEVVEKIYGADADELLELIRGTIGDVDALMLVGHNPEFTDLANKLSPQSIANIPTAGVVCLSFQTNRWEDIGPENARFEYFDYPAKYKEAE